MKGYIHSTKIVQRIAICLLAIALSSCNLFDPDFVKGTIHYTGDPSVDGCGFIINIDNNEYKPMNLSSDYEQDGLKVKVKYEETADGFSCGDLPTPKTTIKILKIKKIN